MSETDRSDLGFVREDIGMVILGGLAFLIGWWFAAGSERGSALQMVGGTLGLAGLVLVLARVIHLGYRLAFPKKPSTPRSP